MKIRHKECTKLVDTLLDINAGIHVHNVLESSFDLTQFKNRINVNNIIMSGFSFGGATALYNAANDSRYKAVILIDGWMFPLKSEPFLNIPQPILFINTHTFHIPSNLTILLKYFHSNGSRQLYTLKNTTHESCTDTAFIHGHWLDILMWKKMDPKLALNLQSSLSIRFLRDTIGYPNNCCVAEILINKHENELVEDIIRYSKRAKRIMGVYPSLW